MPSQGPRNFLETLCFNEQWNRKKVMIQEAVEKGVWYNSGKTIKIKLKNRQPENK